MANTISEQVDAATATIAGGLDAIQADVTAIATELQAAVPPVGSTISQAQADSLSALADRVGAIRSSLDALVVPPAPPASP